jgi:hypothetical protein
VSMVLYLVNAHSLKAAVPLYLGAFFIYMALIIKLGAFSVAELALAREGFGFLRALTAEKSERLRVKPS